MTLNINENNASEYTTPESTTSAQSTSQIETSTNTQLVRIPTRIVSPRQNTQESQSYSETLPRRNITFTFPPSPEETIQDRTQNITSSRDISVNVLSPTRTIPNSTRNTTRPIYDPPSVPSVFKYSNKTSQPENHYNNNLPTFNQNYDPFNYSFFHHLIQIFKRIILNMHPNLTKIFIQQHNIHIHIYYKLTLHKVNYLHKIKEHRIQTLYNLLIEDLKILHFHIYLLTLYTK